MISVNLTGDWNKLIKGLVSFEAKMLDTIEGVTFKSAEIGSEILIQNIQSGGSLVGEPFEPNSPFTNNQSILIASGGLIGSISPLKVSSFQSIANVGSSIIGGWQEEGTGRNPRAEGQAGNPERPFVRPVGESALLSNKVEENANQELEKMMRELFG